MEPASILPARPERTATPRHFRNMLDTCATVFQRKLDVIHKQESRLASGLTKLKEATTLYLSEVPLPSAGWPIVTMFTIPEPLHA